MKLFLCVSALAGVVSAESTLGCVASLKVPAYPRLYHGAARNEVIPCSLQITSSGNASEVSCTQRNSRGLDGFARSVFAQSTFDKSCSGSTTYSLALEFLISEAGAFGIEIRPNRIIGKLRKLPIER
jgi:hypothetical protein